MNYAVHEPNLYELLSQMIEHNLIFSQELSANCDTYPSDYEAECVILEIWLPIFKSKHTLKTTLERIALAFNNQAEADLCRHYLAVLQGITNENK